jgi:arylsulfatase A
VRLKADRVSRCFGDTELYSLAVDGGETRNLVNEQIKRAANLKAKLAKWRMEVIVRMPIPNHNHNPKRASEWWSMHTGKPVPSDNRRRFPATEKVLRQERGR